MRARDKDARDKVITFLILRTSSNCPRSKHSVSSSHALGQTSYQAWTLWSLVKVEWTQISGSHPPPSSWVLGLQVSAIAPPKRLLGFYGFLICSLSLKNLASDNFLRIVHGGVWLFGLLYFTILFHLSLYKNVVFKSRNTGLCRNDSLSAGPSLLLMVNLKWVGFSFPGGLSLILRSLYICSPETSQ